MLLEGVCWVNRGKHKLALGVVNDNTNDLLLSAHFVIVIMV